MVSISYKIINGKEYIYAKYSFRLPSGKVKNISKLLNNPKDIEKSEIKEYFNKKEEEEYINHALHKYPINTILDKNKIEKIERYRFEYKRILKSLTKNQMSDVLDRFTANFTYESNAIEGNSLTLKDVTMILSENFVPKGKDLREVYETKNTRKANELLFKHKIKINNKGIIILHKTLVKDTNISFGYKKLPNFLIMRDVKTTLPENVRAEMENLISWYEKSKNKLHPIMLATEFHGRFEKIHPFEDGNGRVGRLLINVILLEHNYPPLIIRKMTRQPYFSALQAFDNGHKTKLERFMIEKFEETFEKFFRVYVKYL